VAHEQHARPGAAERRAGGGRRARARRRTDRGADRPEADLERSREGVESEHLRPLEGAVTAINEQFDIILGALPGIASKAAIVAERRPR
jgi:hypothetical protein